MEYESSYDTGLKPFNHDKQRGKWKSSKDFFFACAGHAFKADSVMVMPIMIFEEVGIFALIPYLIILAVCVVPIVFLQSFLGQFSSTGFISVLRISPLFKGIGYVALVLNFLTLTYYSIFSAIPMFYFFHSLRPTIPWSCEAYLTWKDFNINRTTFCMQYTEEKPESMTVAIPSVEFFISHLNIASYYNEVHYNSFSIELMLCTCIIWGIVTYVILNSTELIGRIVKYSFIAMLAIMTICLIRFAFLPGAIDGLWHFLLPEKHRLYWDTWIFLPSLALSTLGPGWGSILTMASFNDFKTNIFTYSWVLCLAQFGLMIGISFLSILIKFYMATLNPEVYDPLWHTSHTQWLEFLSIPTALSFLEMPHFWSLIFFSMWILGSMNILIIQFLSLLTSLFDEFEELREIKRNIIFGLVAILSFTSILFCSNHGVYLFQLLTKLGVVTQTVLNLLLLLVVLWIYGRERFQRDLNFMTSRTYSTWMVNVVRFVAPLFLIIVFAFIPYLILLAVCVVPIVFLQSFLGQFSSTGFISAFRISPVFKGIGYVALVFNFLTLTYYSIFTAIPMFYFFHSLTPTIPWSCEAALKWKDRDVNRTSFCNRYTQEIPESFTVAIPSVEFFISHLNISDYYDEVHYTSFSFELMFFTCITWGIVAYVILNSTQLIGSIVKYSFITLVAIMTICLFRFAFLPGAFDGLWHFMFPEKYEFSLKTWIFLPTMALSALGPGWASVLTMASFNNFKTNIYTYSWVLCLAQFGLMIGMALLSILIKMYMATLNPEAVFWHTTQTWWLEFLSIPTALTFLEMPHFWSFIFFIMWILGSLNVLVIQFLSLLTSLFDEFEKLRENKRNIIFGLVAFLSFTSILFCSNHGVYIFQLLIKLGVVTQTILNFFLLLVVLWIYGRERFQRDLNFMISGTYSTLMVYIVRLITPFLLIVTLLMGLLISFEFDYSPSPLAMRIVLIITLVFLLTWCLIPGYCFIKIIRTTGKIGIRLRRCVRGTNWIPADPVDKQRYEETLNKIDF